MHLHDKLEALLELARQIGLTVRREAQSGDGGGYCVLKGRRILFVDTVAPVDVQYDKALAALALQPEIESRYLPPQIRDDLERQRADAD